MSESPAMNDVASPQAAPRHVYLIDGSGFIFRAYHALPPLTRSDGIPTSAVLGFSNMLAKLLDETDADHIAVIFDHSGQSFRNKIYDQYKAHRPDAPDDLKPQFALVRAATDAFSVCRIELEDYEADDLIATYAREAENAGAVVTIVSSDKDLMQLVGGKITMYDPMKNRQIGDAEVRERFGVGPDKVIEVQALCGDSVDNVPGVPGIGVKTAAELINTYGDLETLLDRAGEIKQPKRRESLIEHADKARLSKVLVTLDTKAPMPCPLSDLRVKPMDPDKLLPWLKDMEFRTLATRMAQRLSGAIAVAEAAAAGPAEAVMPEIPPFTAPHDYTLVDTLEGLDLWIEAATNIGAVAIWPAASAVAGSRPALAGISLALAPGKAAYVPLAHRAPGSQQSLDLDAPLRSNALSLDDAITRLKPLFEDRSVLKIVPDAKAAAHMLMRHGITLGPYDCTMLMSYVLDGGQVEHAIEPLTQRTFEHSLSATKDLLGTGKNQVAFAEIVPEAARDYAAERADAALRVHGLLKARLVREKMTAFYETIERPLVPAVAEMENNGIRLDHAALGDMSRDFARRIAEIETAVYRDVGHEFNIGSTKQLGEVLFEKLGMPGGRKGKTGAYGTDASILEQLVPLHPVPGRVLEWRQLTKLKSTYADALGDQIDGETGRVHTTYALAATSTGRLSSTDPNLQNIPIRTEEGRKIRAAFVAAPGACAAVGRLQPDRIAPRRPCRRHRGLEGGLPCRPRYPRRDRERGVRRAARNDGPRNAPPRQGDQFRHPLRHQRVRARQPDRRDAGRGSRLHRQVFRALPRHPRLHGKDQGRVPHPGLCRNDFRPQMLHSRHSRPEPDAPRRRRAPGDQRAAARLRRRHHQARHEPPPRRAGESRADRETAAPGPRRTPVRGARSRDRRHRRARQGNHGRRLRPALRNLGAPCGRNRLRPKLGRRALKSLGVPPPQCSGLGGARRVCPGPAVLSDRAGISRYRRADLPVGVVRVAARRRSGIARGKNAPSPPPLCHPSPHLGLHQATWSLAMSFRITGLSAEEFAPLFDLSDEALAARGAVRRVAEGGQPCRVSLTDSEPGDELILVNHEHHPVASPYRMRFAVYVRRGEETYDRVDAVPEQLRIRTLAVRAFDAERDDGRGFIAGAGRQARAGRRDRAPPRRPGRRLSAPALRRSRLLRGAGRPGLMTPGR